MKQHIHRIKHHAVKHKMKAVWVIEGVILTFILVSLFGYLFVRLSGGEVKDPDSLLNKKTVVLSCDNDYSISPTYFITPEKGNEGKLQLVITKDGKTYELMMKQGVSPSGVEYETEDGKDTFWEHQGMLTYTSHGLTLSTCKELIDPLTAIKNRTYSIGGNSFDLLNGSTPDASAGSKHSLFGDPVFGDINRDGVDDAVVVLAYSQGESVFYYAMTLLQDSNGYFQETTPVLLGDRVSPQTVDIQNGDAHVNYVVRNQNESFAVPPSLGKTLTFHYDDNKGEVLAKDGVMDTRSVDPTQMSLGMKTWVWVKTETENGVIIKPKKDGVFTVTFDRKMQAHITTDCDTVEASYTLHDDSLLFQDMNSQYKYCERSQEVDFLKGLNKIIAYTFTKDGELKLIYGAKRGEIIFK